MATLFETIAAPSRRQVMTAALGSGFALAVRPVSAQTITTPTTGLDVAELKIPNSSGDIPAYRAKPQGKGKPPRPLVLVVHEIFGVHEHIKDVCRRLAKAGYCAIAPELFARHGDVSKLSDVKEIREVVAKAPDFEVLGDLDATVAWAKSTGEADTERLGINGFCWGGRIAWLYAAASRAHLKAGVAWYGRLLGDRDGLHPHHPIDVAAKLKAPVLGLYGGEDPAIPVSSVDEMRKALAVGDAPSRHSEITVYPQAGHAFFADYRPSYRKDAAEDGWKRMAAWFKANGVG